ncbi:MAG: hypothetical protein OEY28_13065 [Nitrospira sp.]|nr:hypothetical protein [Nitrospira sp.]
MMLKSPTPTNREGRALYICKQIATVVLALFFVGLFFGSGVGWLLYSLKYLEPITGEVPSSFPIIVKGTTDIEGRKGSTELITWSEWEKRKKQEQGTMPVWVENGTGQGQQDREGERRLLYTYRMSEEAPQRHMVHVSITDQDDVEIRAQYRVEGPAVIPVAFRNIHGSMMIGVMPMAFVGILLLGLSLRAALRWYTRHTKGNIEIWQLMRDYDPSIRQPYTLSMLVGYYLFLGGRGAVRLVRQRS